MLSRHPGPASLAAWLGVRFGDEVWSGAGDGNRTHVTSLEGWSSTIELRPPRRELPPNYKRLWNPFPARRISRLGAGITGAWLCLVRGMPRGT